MILLVVLSLKTARSGTSPIPQKENEIVKYVETADRFPKKGRCKIDPYAVLIGQRQKITCKPRPSRVNNREDTCGHNCKDRHCFRESCNTRSPSLSEEEEDSRDKCSRMPDTDPENKVDDIKHPADHWNFFPTRQYRSTEYWPATMLL